NRVEKVGKNVRVYVTGSDLLDGTPIIDIKPYIQYSDAVIEAQSGYAQDEPQRKSVIWTEEAEQQKQQFMSKGKVSPQILQELEKVLSLDPRPAYQDDEQRVYGMKFADLDVRFLVRELSVYISEIEYTEL
ncbi:TrmO family methyltransferase domain-containing protein, partial [Acinetobacter indicus]